MCALLSMLIITLNPSKDAKKRNADSEVVRSNIKLLVNNP